MGGVCSGGTTKQNRKVGENNSKHSGKLKSVKGSSQKQHSNAKIDDLAKNKKKMSQEEQALPFSGELSSKPDKKGTAKASQKKSFLERGGITGLAMTVEVLDALGSSMSNLNANSGFTSGAASRGNKISILAFEVANTIAKGANLFQSLSDENIQFLKKDILHSEGVQKLVSTNMNELLMLAAADKREELDVFLREVIRFGNLCKDPQWHNLDRYFSNLKLEYFNHKQLTEESETRMKELTTLAQHTSELYHELNAVDRFDQDYRRKLEELDSLNLPRKGESLMILQSELKQQKKLVRSLTKKSLWSRSLEEIVEKLVDIASYIHEAILEAFGNDGRTMTNGEPNSPERLGLAGLALHYANVINQMDNIASRPTSLPPNIRDTLYHGLPRNVKTAIRSQLKTVNVKEELPAFQIKAEMEKTLQWLVPVATNTMKAHQGFGWVGEWANTGHEFGKSTTTNNSPARLQTLYHADKHKTEKYILELVIWLNRLISVLRNRDHGSRPLPTRSPTNEGMVLHSKMQRILSLNNDTKTRWIKLSPEDRNLLDKVSARRLIPGISKSQEFSTAKKGCKIWALSRSTGSSPNREMGTRHSLECPKANILDIMDGIDSRFCDSYSYGLE